MSADVPERAAVAWLEAAQQRGIRSDLDSSGPEDWYRLGDGFLGIRSAHDGFRRRFARLFGACRETPPPATSAPLVRCAIGTTERGAVSLIRFDDPEELDAVDFAVHLFGDRGCRELDGGAFDGRALGITAAGSAAGSAVVLGVSGSTLLARNDQPWEWIVGNLAVHRTLRLQSGVAVLHAGSVGVRGRGLLLVGPKGSGKTTLTLAIAARGHAFLGDEMAAVRLDARELVPMRRTTSVRPGPCSPRVESALRASGIPAEDFPDGTSRVRARIDELFPTNGADTTPLDACIFLREMSDRPLLQPFEPRRQHLELLTPLGSTMWRLTAAQRAVRLLGILSGAKCYFLDVGAADSTAELLEATVDETWG